MLAATTFSQDEATIRVWYISDGQNIAKFTYTSEGPIVPAELEVRERVIRTVRWRKAG